MFMVPLPSQLMFYLNAKYKSRILTELHIWPLSLTIVLLLSVNKVHNVVCNFSTVDTIWSV